MARKICTGWVVLAVLILFTLVTKEHYTVPSTRDVNRSSVDGGYGDYNPHRRLHAPFQFESPESWPFKLQSNATALNVPGIGPMPYPSPDQM